MFAVILVSAAIRLGQAAAPPLSSAVLSVLRGVHRTAASLEVLIVIWLGWLAWRAWTPLAWRVAIAAVLTFALAALGLLAGRAPPAAAAMANLLGGLALAAIFAETLRLLRGPRHEATTLSAAIGAALVAAQCLLGAWLAVSRSVMSSVALPVHAVLGIALSAGGVWLALRMVRAQHRRAGVVLAMLVPVSGFTALQFETSAAAAFAHAVPVALLVIAAGYTRLRTTGGNSAA